MSIEFLTLLQAVDYLKFSDKICVDNYLFSLNTYPFVDSGKNTCYYWQCTYLFYNSVHKKYDRCQSRIVTIRYHDHLYFHLDKYGIIKKTKRVFFEIIVNY